MRIDFPYFTFGMTFFIFVAVAAEEIDEQPVQEESEPMFGTLDYILLAIIGAAAVWWLFFKDSEGDKIPEVTLKTKNL